MSQQARASWLNHGGTPSQQCRPTSQQPSIVTHHHRHHHHRHHHHVHHHNHHVIAACLRDALPGRRSGSSLVGVAAAADGAAAGRETAIQQPAATPCLRVSRSSRHAHPPNYIVEISATPPAGTTALRYPGISSLVDGVSHPAHPIAPNSHDNTCSGHCKPTRPHLPNTTQSTLGRGGGV